MNWFESWSSLGWTALSGIIAYGALVMFLGVSGKRTLSKINAFDFGVTIALGSTLGSVITSEQLPLANGLLALALLIALQYLIAWLASRTTWFRRLIRSEPVLLFRQGEFLDHAFLGSRVSRDKVIAAVRKEGVGDLAEVAAVVMETAGTFSVLDTWKGSQAPSTLEHVSGPDA